MVEANDYPRRFFELMTNLSLIEERPIPDIITDIATADPVS